MSKAMVIESRGCSGGTCTSTYEVVDYDHRADAVYGVLDTKYRGWAVRKMWESGGGEDRVEINPKAPKEAVKFIL